MTMNLSENEKFVNGKWVGEAIGKSWKQFFVHLTMIGLAEGESCEFSDIKRD